MGKSSFMSAPHKEPSVHLTSRERAVLSLIADGLTGREIAAKMNVSVKTVATHRQHLFSKFDVHNSILLIRRAVSHGLLKF